MTKKEKTLKITQGMIDEMDDIVIPELEEAKKLVRNVPWTKRDLAVLRKYYGKVPIPSLLDYFKKEYPPYGRTRNSVEHEACRLGLTLTRKKREESL